MKNTNRWFRMLRVIVALTGALTITATVEGCIAGSGQGKDDEIVGQVESESQPGNCCSFGFYSCSSLKNGGGSDTFDYDPDGCGLVLKPQALSQCTAACRVACTDSGWILGC
jgi:hypothetical protein